jgi:RHS repeat-associated protein
LLWIESYLNLNGYDKKGNVIFKLIDNADGLRTKKTANHNITHYTWNGANLAKEQTGDITSLYNYDVTGIHSADMNGTVNAYIKDTHGNVIGVTDDTGVIVNNYEYDAFGVQISGDSVPSPFGYCGEYLDNESGLIYLRNRYYDAGKGRFINEDPIKDGLNWYAYCGNNPVSFVDPNGLIFCDSDTQPEELEKARKNNSVVVHEREEAIDIYLKLYIYGEMADKTAENGMTYKQAALQGITDGWQGEYDYKTVNVIINNLSGTLNGLAEEKMIQNQSRHTVNGYNVITVEILSGMYYDSKQNATTNGVAWYESDNKLRPNCIKLYTGGKGYAPISINDFIQTAGHEMGHELGLVDAYNDNIVGEGTAYENSMPSIMRYQWTVNGAQQIDYYSMMKAQRTNRPQRYGGNFLEVTGNGLSWFGYNRIK